MEVRSVKITDIIPYEKNAKKHPKEQIENIAQSIKKFGWAQPVVIDRNGVIIIGHGRVAAAKKLNLDEVPCVVVDDLTEEEVKMLRLADNKLNESDWDLELLAEDIAGLDFGDFDFDWGDSTDLARDGTEEELSQEELEQQFRERMASGELSEDSEEYQEFLQKFEAKKTTDDCYTPQNIYDQVKEWAVNEYLLDGCPIIRPFYPGGDYKNEKYPKNCVVIDNPPFSIISEICCWFAERGIRFFLFGPTLTILGIASGAMNYVVTGAGVVYENGASVTTSFVTNMGEYKIRSAPDLREAMDRQNAKNLKAMKKELPKYRYPLHALTATMVAYYSAHGEEFKCKSEDCCFIRALDEQKEKGKGMFGSGFLLSEKAAAEKAAAEKAAAEKAAAEKAAAEVWNLSTKEREIIRKLGGKAV